MQKVSLQRKRQLAWYMYDWANSAFGTIIITFVFGVYMTRTVMGGEAESSGYWSLTIGASGLIIAALAPLLGGMADRAHGYMKWLRVTTLSCVSLTLLLVFIHPDASWPLVLFALLIVALANTAAELSYVFYNALLPSISTPANIGRVSGTAWGIGFLGGIGSLALVLVLFIGIGDFKPLLPISQEQDLNIRSCVVFVSLWYLIFSIPLFFYHSDISEKKPAPSVSNLKQLI